MRSASLPSSPDTARSSASSACARATSISPRTQVSGAISSSVTGFIVGVFFRFFVLDLEARDRALQFDREVGELTNRHGGLLGTARRLLVQLQDVLHGAGNLRCDGRLF